MRKAAIFLRSETGYLFVEMKIIPVCLRFQQCVSIVFPSHLAFIHLLYSPLSWRCLSLFPTPDVPTFIVVSLGVRGWGRMKAAIDILHPGRLPF